MKVVVDTMPKKASDCLFAKYGESGILHCGLRGYVCCQLESNSKCEHLLPMNGMEFIIGQQARCGR